jgi:acyl-CoA synthetase (AMP-forming)/AMP-acid ligase II
VLAEEKEIGGFAMNIIEPILAQCRNKPSELALCAPGTDFNLVSYARLQRSVNNICRRIISADIAPRSRIAVLIEDPVLHLMIVIALTQLGIVTAFARPEVAHLPFRCDGVIVDQQYEALVGQTVLMADTTWTEGDGESLPEKQLYRAGPDDLCGLFLSSVSGRQTAIAITHGMIAARLDRQKLLLGPRAPFCDRTHLDLLLRRPIGLQVMFGTLWRGGALVMGSDAEKTLAALTAYRVQNIIAGPQTLLKLADAARGYSGWHSAVIAVFCLRGLAEDPANSIRSHLCSNLSVGYVAADATMVASMPFVASANPGAAGYLLPGIMLEIVDDNDRVLPPGHEGNLRIRSEYGVKEYFEDPEATHRAFRNGWFYPGDRGYLTAEKLLVLSETGLGATATEDAL